MVPSGRAYGGRRQFLCMSCVRNSACQRLEFLNAGREGEEKSFAGCIRLFFQVRFVLFLVLGSGTLGPVEQGCAQWDLSDARRAP